MNEDARVSLEVYVKKVREYIKENGKDNKVILPAEHDLGIEFQQYIDFFLDDLMADSSCYYGGIVFTLLDDNSIEAVDILQMVD